MLFRSSSHISFNSLTQYARFWPMAKAHNEAIGQPQNAESVLQQICGAVSDSNDSRVSCGLRVNPEYSEVEVELYNPCAPGSRFGILASQLPDELPEGIEGFHCHCHCESDSHQLERTLQHIEKKFAKWLPQLKWLNLGGGHLMTRADYDVEHLIGLLQGLKARYPHLHIILEPGSAFAWQTGPLVASVVDVVENYGIRTAILNVSFTCHMPDCLPAF